MSVLDVPIVLVGYGPVGQAYVRLVRGRSDALEQRYAYRLRIAAVTGRSTQCQLAGPNVPPRSEWGPRVPLARLIVATGARVVVQAYPSDPGFAAVAAEEALTAWRLGAHVVTATKCHVLAHWRRLRRASADAGLGFGVSATTGAALPAADVARHALLGYDIRAVRACLNGTSTYVVDRMGDGASLAEAVADARQRGIAEADTAADLSGADAAGKVRILAGLLWDWDVSTLDTDLAPITAATAEEAVAARRAGTRLRAVAVASVDRPGLVSVQLERLGETDPLAAIAGPEKAVSYDCGEIGVVTVSGGASSPLGAATALLKDTLTCATDPAVA
ncbi:homoserine dehydrogenase [Actinopolymorpha alba]|uniref:homoserine dehydrogenase n=1 Tax=Actinopolymorpha alba TaxID=533267 RepID=UPI000399EC21|nr:homoserine dehydrogenase [Actinopolymorpha alba]